MPMKMLSHSEWLVVDDFYRLLEHVGATCPVSTQRALACSLASVLFEQLPTQAQRALLFAETMDASEGGIDVAEDYTAQLQCFLPEDCSVVPCSAVIWALMPHHSSYPIWYSASIIAGILGELNAVNRGQICEIVKIAAPYYCSDGNSNS
jgi:hypothetical protein